MTGEGRSACLRGATRGGECARAAVEAAVAKTGSEAEDPSDRRSIPASGGASRVGDLCLVRPARLLWPPPPPAPTTRDIPGCASRKPTKRRKEQWSERGRASKRRSHRTHFSRQLSLVLCRSAVASGSVLSRRASSDEGNSEARSMHAASSDHAQRRWRSQGNGIAVGPLVRGLHL